MIANIYDVAHGFTAYVRDEVCGFNALLDCGYNESTMFYPTDQIRAAYGNIDRFYVLNYDEDHLDALPRLRQQVGAMPFNVIGRNPLTAQQILSMKTWPYGAGISAFVDMISHYNNTVFVMPAGIVNRELDISQYWNPYPTFTDTNNLSFVVFVHAPAFSIIFPGDLERAGWKALLLNPNFRADLTRVKIFVAAHHGRGSGYCEEVFNHCSPQVVIISDEPMQYDTQNDCYANHATGISWNGGSETRRVLTTRCDGHIRISTPPGWRFFINVGA